MFHDNVNYYSEISALNPVLLDIVGLFLCMVFILCLMFNFVMLYVFMHYKEIRSSVNKLVMAIAIINLFNSFQFPYLIKSFFAHKYLTLDLEAKFYLILEISLNFEGLSILLVSLFSSKN